MLPRASVGLLRIGLLLGLWRGLGRACLRIPIVLAPITQRPHLAHDLVAHNALVTDEVALSQLVVTHMGEPPMVYDTQPLQYKYSTQVAEYCTQLLSIIPNC